MWVLLNTPAGMVLNMFGKDKSRDYVNIFTGYLFSYFYLVPLIFQAIFGYLVNKYGQRINLILFSYLLFVIALIIFLIYPENIHLNYILIPFLIIAIGYSLFSPIIWSCIKFEVSEKNIGTAFGIV